MTTPNSNKSSQGTGAVKLSYSSMSTLLSCEKKFHCYKVACVPKDPDHEESDALGLGKAFHQVLEKTLHQDYNDILIMEAMAEHNVDPSEKDLLTMMLKKYVEFRKASGIKVIKCELALGTSMFTGFIDAIAIQGNKFYILDLKTAGRHDESILSRLALDPQLNLYASFAGDLDIAVPELVGKEFAGCLYTQVIKSKAGTMAGLEKGVKVYETFVPVEVMNPEEMMSLFSDVHDRAVELHQGAVPKKNFSSCFNYFQPCPYFSQCYGMTFTDNKNKVKLTTIETLKEEDDLL
jgi:hypothetical protein